jgi:hypothetical protein
MPKFRQKKSEVMPFIDAEEVNVRALLSNAKEEYKVPLYSAE